MNRESRGSLGHEVPNSPKEPWEKMTVGNELIDFSFFFFFFLMWAIFKDFIEFVTVLLLFHVLVFWPRGMWDLSSPTRD